MATMATVKAVRYSGGNYLCDVEVNGKLYQNVMVSTGAVNSGNVDLMKKDLAQRLYQLLHRDEPVADTPLLGSSFDIDEAKDYSPPAPEPDPIQEKKARLRELLGPVKERIKNAINDGVITQDDPQVQTVQELKNTGVNPFD